MPTGVGYEPEVTYHWAMEMHRRMATRQELEQGDREMKLAEQRMKKGAEARGGKPLEDAKVEGSRDGRGCKCTPNS